MEKERIAYGSPASVYGQPEGEPERRRVLAEREKQRRRQLQLRRRKRRRVMSAAVALAVVVGILLWNLPQWLDGGGVFIADFRRGGSQHRGGHSAAGSAEGSGAGVPRAFLGDRQYPGLRSGSGGAFSKQSGEHRISSRLSAGVWEKASDENRRGPAGGG